MRGRSDYSFGKPIGQGFGNDCFVGAEIYHLVDVLVVSFLLMGFVVSLLLFMDCRWVRAAVKVGLSLYRRSGRWVLGMVDLLGLFDRSTDHCSSLQACFWKRVAQEHVAMSCETVSYDEDGTKPFVGISSPVSATHKPPARMHNAF